jgi:hypothetical protein
MSIRSTFYNIMPSHDKLLHDIRKHTLLISSVFANNCRYG